MKGYYKCNCGEEYISDFPFQECNCLSCGDTIHLTKEVTDSESEQIKSNWLMRFRDLKFSHIEDNDDVLEVMYRARFDKNVLSVDSLGDQDGTVEVWIQDNNYSVVIIDNLTNDIIEVTENEKKFVLDHLKTNREILRGYLDGDLANLH